MRVCPALSSTIARYCTRVPGASSATSWKTRYGSLSSVPIVLPLAVADLGLERHLVERVAVDVRARPRARSRARRRGHGRARPTGARAAARDARRRAGRRPPTAAARDAQPPVASVRSRPGPSPYTLPNPRGARVRRDRRRRACLGVVERDDVLAPPRAVDARERVDARRPPSRSGPAARRCAAPGVLRDRRERAARLVERVDGSKLSSTGVASEPIRVMQRRRRCSLGYLRSGTCPGARPGRRRRR